MRAVTLAFAFGTALSGQVLPALDVVVLVEDSAAATALVKRTNLRALGLADRVSVMTFAANPSLILLFEDDSARIERTLASLDGQGSRSMRLWDALVAAAELFGSYPEPGRRRAVFLVVRNEDGSSVQTVDTARAALLRNDVFLSVVTVSRGRPVPARPVLFQIPNQIPAPENTDVWNERVPVSPDVLPPSATLNSVEALALETGGLALKNDWDFMKLAGHTRGQ